MNDFWIAISSAIVGGVAGYLASRFQSHFELRRRRRAIATALLVDLRALEGMLAAIEDWGTGNPLRTRRPRLDLLDRVSDYVDVLPKSAVQWLLVVNANLRHLEATLEALPRTDEPNDERTHKRSFWTATVMARNTVHRGIWCRSP